MISLSLIPHPSLSKIIDNSLLSLAGRYEFLDEDVEKIACNKLYNKNQGNGNGDEGGITRLLSCICVFRVCTCRLLYGHMMNFDENGNENRLEHITAFWKQKCICDTYSMATDSEHYHILGGVCAIAGAANPTAAEAMTPSWTNARQLKNHAALKKTRKVSIRALHNCLYAQPVTVVDESLNPSNDAILDKRFGYACSDEKNWISRDLSWNKYPEVYDICLYAGVVWIVRIELLDDFRFSSPSICFAVKIYYPNIDFE
ncbi:ubiquitin-conjugating enzyme E2 4 [Tanacetum coccineum]